MPAIRGDKSKKKTRRHTRDLDQIHADLRDAKHLAQHTETKALEDLPGLGQYYCTECAKWFESEANLGAHKKAKVHKRRYASRSCHSADKKRKFTDSSVHVIGSNNYATSRIHRRRQRLR
jgi:bud site selection protein 20